MIESMHRFFSAIFALAGVLGFLPMAALPQETLPPEPQELAWSPDGATLAVSDAANNQILLLDPRLATVQQALAVQGRPRGLLWPTTNQLFVAEFSSGTIACLQPETGATLHRFTPGGKPWNLILAGDVLLATDYGLHRTLGLSPENGTVLFDRATPRHPSALAAPRNGAYALSGGLLPAGPASATMATALHWIDLANPAASCEYPLPTGSGNLRAIAIDRDGKFAFVTHTRGQIALPTTQPDRGWINVNALSVFDLTARQWVATFLLDTPVRGAADPWGAVVLDDGRVALAASGTGELIFFDWPRAQRLLRGEEVLEIGAARRQYHDPGTPGYGGTPAQLWARIAANPEARALLASDLAVTTGPGLAPRTPTGAQGLRSLALSPDGRTLAAIAFFDATVLLFDAPTGQLRATIALADSPFEESLARQGERLFHDARLSFQSWMSCATCHPEGRADGMNWDLLNDGIGNPKNTKSMLYAPRTEPMTWLGAREDHRLSIQKGMHFFMAEQTAEQVRALQAYLQSLTPEPSPFLERRADGTTGLSAAALRGEKVFREIGCARCHSGPLFTDLKKYDVGSSGAEDGYAPYDTPPLIELWRTGPYLHNGAASTLHDALILCDPLGKHSPAAQCTPNELNDLILYLLSL
jgi:mono/diheme cytochrome c family protein